MQSIMVNRKLFGSFEFSQPLCRNVLSYYFVLFRSLHIRRKQQKTKTETKKDTFCGVFARKRPFLSQIKRWFSVFYRYIGQITPHPPVFCTRRVGQLSSEIFYFFIFCKILRFYQFRFSTEFWAFSGISYLLFFLHKVS